MATLAPEAGLVATAPLLRDRPVLTHRDMAMGHGAMDHGGMDHVAMGPAAAQQQYDHKLGAAVDMVAVTPVSRLDEPGLGLEDAPHRVLRYSELRSLAPNPDTRAPEREVEIHLTGNMERYMWSFDGVKFSHIDKPILFREGERVRVTLVNDTMMTHPIHLHGMFFDLVATTAR